MEWVRLMKMVVVRSEALELLDIREIVGPGWHWDSGGASYHILEMQDDRCWDSPPCHGFG